MTSTTSSLGVLLLLSALYSLSCGVTWMTNTTEPWTFECPKGQTIKIISSIWDSSNDRYWNFSCVRVPTNEDEITTTNCEWSGNVNQAHGDFHYQCHNDAILTGIATDYDTSNHDRLYKFQCCDVPDFIPHACEYTAEINDYREVLYYRVPDDMVIRGVDSMYVSSYDRAYRLNVCEIDLLLVPETPVGR